jgi:hypothetical protein
VGQTAPGLRALGFVVVCSVVCPTPLFVCLVPNTHQGLWERMSNASPSRRHPLQQDLQMAVRHFPASAQSSGPGMKQN